MSQLSLNLAHRQCINIVLNDVIVKSIADSKELRSIKKALDLGEVEELVKLLVTMKTKEDINKIVGWEEMLREPLELFTISESTLTSLRSRFQSYDWSQRKNPNTGVKEEISIGLGLAEAIADVDDILSAPMMDVKLGDNNGVQ